MLYPTTLGGDRRRGLRRFFARTRVGDLLLCPAEFSRQELRLQAAEFGLLLEFEATVGEPPHRQSHICRVIGRFARGHATRGAA